MGTEGRKGKRALTFSLGILATWEFSVGSRRVVRALSRRGIGGRRARAGCGEQRRGENGWDVEGNLEEGWSGGEKWEELRIGS